MASWRRFAANWPPLQLAQIAHRRRAIILFEGLEGAGKKFALKQLAAAFDPCHYAVTLRRSSTAARPPMAIGWRVSGAICPGPGRTMVFYRSWYRRVLDERLAGLVDGDALARCFDEINEFEAQQRDYGTLIVKLYFDVSAPVQERRLAERAANPWQSATGEGATRISHPVYGQAFSDLRDHSDTRWSPWTMISDDDEGQAAIAALRAVIEAYRQGCRAIPRSRSRPAPAPP